LFSAPGRKPGDLETTATGIRSAGREVSDREFEEERGAAVVNRETTSIANVQETIDDAQG
jgi:hypothetical protein